jgi:O-antigen/teichoic acid export membrane protein
MPPKNQMKIREYLGNKSSILAILKTTRVRQVASLYSSSIAAIFIGIAVSVQNARLLGPENFGNYQYLLNLFNFFLTFVSFGFYATGGKMLATENNNYIKKEIASVLLILTIVISLIFSFLIFFYSFFEDSFFGNGLGYAVRLFSPFFIVLAIHHLLTPLFTGTNKIFSLSVLNLLPKSLFLLVVFFFSLYFAYSHISALALYLFSFGLITFTLLRYVDFDLRIKGFRKALKYIWEENKISGLPVYVGGLFGVATSHFAAFALSYYSTDNQNVGFFSLAVMTCSPLGLIPVVIGRTYYVKLANNNQLPKGPTLVAVLITAISLLFYLLLIKPLVLLLYSETYLQAVPLMYIISFGVIIHGFGDYINLFLFNHGFGKSIRNIAVLTGILNVLGYLILVKYFDIFGAAYTKLLADTVYFSLMLIKYLKFKSNVRNTFI